MTSNFSYDVSVHHSIILRIVHLKGNWEELAASGRLSTFTLLENPYNQWLLNVIYYSPCFVGTNAINQTNTGAL